MSDNQQWQAPGSTPSAPPAAPPPPGYQLAPAAAPSWTPPPKPGLIPLRPLTLGAILGASFRVLRRNPRPTFGISLLLQGIATIVGFGVVGLVALFAFSRVDFATGDNVDTISAGSYALGGLSLLVPIALSLISSALLQGIIVLEVSRATLGEKQKFSQLWARGRGRLGALIGWTILLAVAGIVALGIIVGLIVLFVSTLGTVGIVLGVLLGIVGGLGLAVVYAWLTTKLAFVSSALVLERLSIRGAIARSWSLTRGYFWRTFGIQLLVFVILYVASQIVSTPVSVIGSLVIALTDPNGQVSATTVIYYAIYFFVIVALALVIGAITAVVETSTTALLYIDLRIRKEGLDLDLARFVEARQAGDTTVPDPYLPTPAA